MNIYKYKYTHTYIHEISSQTKLEKKERQINYSLCKEEIQMNSKGI